MRPLLENVQRDLRVTLQAQKAEMGFNLAGLNVAGRRVAEISENEYVDNNMINERATTEGKKRAFINVA